MGISEAGDWRVDNLKSSSESRKSFMVALINVFDLIGQVNKKVWYKTDGTSFISNHWSVKCKIRPLKDQ